MSTALLVIDAQKIYTEKGADLFCLDSKGTIDRINHLIKKFERNRLPIIFVRHIHKSDGSDLGRMFDYLGKFDDFNFKAGTSAVEYDDALYRPENMTEIIKNRYSAFVGTDLSDRLKRLHVKRVVIVGFMTNCCCDSTARDAHDHDLYVDFAPEATGTPGTETLNERRIRAIVAELMENAFARVLTVRQALDCNYTD